MIEYSRTDKLNNFCLIARQYDAPIIIQSDAVVSAGIFTENYTQNIDPLIKHYLYVVKGSAKVNGHDCIEGDAIMYEDVFQVTIENPDDCEIILFNLV